LQPRELHRKDGERGEDGEAKQQEPELPLVLRIRRFRGFRAPAALVVRQQAHRTPAII
jgi:hypothetical protein